MAGRMPKMMQAGADAMPVETSLMERAERLIELNGFQNLRIMLSSMREHIETFYLSESLQRV
jgi:hypothetical protein